MLICRKAKSSSGRNKRVMWLMREISFLKSCQIKRTWNLKQKILVFFWRLRVRLVKLYQLLRLLVILEQKVKLWLITLLAHLLQKQLLSWNQLVLKFLKLLSKLLQQLLQKKHLLLTMSTILSLSVVVLLVTILPFVVHNLVVRLPSLKNLNLVEHVWIKDVFQLRPTLKMQKSLMDLRLQQVVVST